MSAERIKQIAQYLADWIADKFDVDCLMNALIGIGITEDELAQLGYGFDDE